MQTTALMYAASAGSKDIVQALLDGGALLNERAADAGYTALHFACSRGHASVVQLLLEAGADVNAKDSYGRSALAIVLEYLGADAGPAETLRKLYEYGIDTEQYVFEITSDMRSARLIHFNRMEAARQVDISERNLVEAAEREKYLRNNVQGVHI
jgi:hypothetical protein